MKPLYVVPGGKRMHLYPECIPARSQHRDREATKAEAMALKLCDRCHVRLMKNR